MTLSQMAAIGIFIVMLVEFMSERMPRYLVSLLAGACTIVVVFLVLMHSVSAVSEALSLNSILQSSFWYNSLGEEAIHNTGINWSTILFITGMMIMVEGMSEAGCFDWLCLLLAKMVHYQLVPLFLCFMLLSAALSMFIDSITVILFLAVVSIRLSHLIGFDPIPFMIGEIFTANLGGAATMSGDPPNIIIGTSLGLTFQDFLSNTGLLSLVGLAVIIPYFYFCFRRELHRRISSFHRIQVELDPRSAVTNKTSFVLSSIIFLSIVVLLVTHVQTGFTAASVGAIAAGATLAIHHNPLKLLCRVDWQTILFFIGLFVAVSGLEQTGILDAVANSITSITGGSTTAMVIVLVLLSAIFSAFVDNIPFAAAMVPVMTSLSVSMGMNLHTLVWAVSIGTDVGGSATPIGASANVAGTAIAARSGHPISWQQYCKYSVPATVIVVALSIGLILLRY